MRRGLKPEGVAKNRAIAATGGAASPMRRGLKHTETHTRKNLFDLGGAASPMRRGLKPSKGGSANGDAHLHGGAASPMRRGLKPYKLISLACFSPGRRRLPDAKGIETSCRPTPPLLLI